jgi:uncharacterized protein HemX
MAAEGEATEVIEEAPKGKSGALLVIVFSVLLGVALIAGIVGGVFYYQSAKAVRAELAAMKKEVADLKAQALQPKPEKDDPALEAALKDMKQQIESLSGQIGVLTTSIAERAASEGDAAVTPAQKNGASASHDVRKAETSPRKVEVKDCNLIGKSPEEQAAILKHCVSLIDPRDEKR